MRNETERLRFGIAKGTTVDMYIKEFQKLPIEAVMYYVYDQPLKGWKQGVAKDELWYSIPEYAEMSDTCGTTHIHAVSGATGGGSAATGVTGGRMRSRRTHTRKARC